MCVCLFVRLCGWSICLFLWQRPCASAGDESALHCISLHVAHLGEVHPLLGPTWWPLTLRLGFLTHWIWTKRQTDSDLIAIFPLHHHHYNTRRHTNWIFMWPSQLMISIRSAVDSYLVGSGPPLSEGSGQGDRKEAMQMWCLYMMSDMCLCVYAALPLSSSSMSLLLPHHGLVLEDAVFWPLQTFLPLAWIAFFVNSLCTKCYCNIVQ